MIRVFLLVCVAFAALGNSQALDWNDLRAKFSSTDPFHVNSFFKLPRTLEAAESEGWTTPPETKSDEHIKTRCRKDDPRVCLGFDNKGSIAAYKVAIPQKVDELNMPGINYEGMGWKKVTLYEQELYQTTIYFESQEVIESGGRDWDEQTGSGLWLQMKDNLEQIANDEKDISNKNPLFVKQNCYKGMGQHYFYNVSPNQTTDGYLPWFVLYSEKGEIQGFGLVVFGSKATSSWVDWVTWAVGLAERSWFELLPSFAIRAIAPDVAQWILDYVDKYGPYSHHVYMKDEPWKIACAEKK